MLGWLHVTPEDAEKPRSETEAFPLPPCEPFDYVVEWFTELRITFGYSDLDAWARLTGQTLEPWEVALLMDMTNTYSSAVSKYRAKAYNLRPPYDGRTREQIAAAVSAKFEALEG